MKVMRGYLAPHVHSLIINWVVNTVALLREILKYSLSAVGQSYLSSDHTLMRALTTRWLDTAQQSTVRHNFLRPHFWNNYVRYQIFCSGHKIGQKDVTNDIQHNTSHGMSQASGNVTSQSHLFHWRFPTRHRMTEPKIVRQMAAAQTQCRNRMFSMIEADNNYSILRKE